MGDFPVRGSRMDARSRMESYEVPPESSLTEAKFQEMDYELELAEATAYETELERRAEAQRLMDSIASKYLSAINELL